MTDQKELVRIGVVGAGHLGRFHIECLSRIKGFSLQGFHDADTEVSIQIADKYNIESFNDLDSLLDHVDAVCVVTPTKTHFDLGMKVIDAGKHLFIEKPLTDDPESSKKLASKLADKKLIGRVGHVERYNPAFVAAKNFGLNKPVFIEAHRLAPFNLRGMDVPVVMDLMIHDIDIVLSIIDSEVDHIEANGVV